MTIAERSPQAAPFRIEMLWRDERYRSVTIQIIALMALMLGAAWLINNAVENLARLGKTFSFGFLFQTAGYDIPFSLIEYTNRDAHLRAVIVGFLNTILVAVMGCIAATIVGTIIGVARLSKNWLISQITMVWVEIFRNVPVLLWIVATVAVLTELTSSPREFRDPDGAEVTGTLFIHNRGVNLAWPTFGEGSWIVVAVFALSIAAIVFVRRYAKRRQDETGEQLPVLPIALALFFIPAPLTWYFAGQPIGMDYPVLGGFNFQGGLDLPSAMVGLWLGLSLYTSAFIAEIVRAGILSVPKGQTEAAFAVGLRPNVTMRLVILPQALRVIIPPLISQYLNLTKNSSLAIAVGFLEATGTLGNITRNQTGKEMECILLLMAFYLTLSLIISAIMNAYNARVRLVER